MLTLASSGTIAGVDLSAIETLSTSGGGETITLSAADAAGKVLSPITFMAVNDMPAFSNLDGGSAYTENDSPVVIDGDVTVADTELDALNAGAGNYGGASVTIARNGGASASDVFGSSGSLGALTEGQTFTFGGTTVGTVTANSNGTLVLTFNSNATSAIVDGVLQSITYAKLSELPCAGVTLDYTFNDGTADSAGSNQATVTINSVNDAPVLNDGASPVLSGITEDAGDDDASGADGDDDATDNTNNPGTSVAALVVDGSITDPDGAAIEAIAVTAVDNTNGLWQLSTDNRDSWADFSTIVGQTVDLSGSARLLDGTLTGGATQLIRFVPDVDYNGTATITFRAWDRSVGAVGGTADASSAGGTTAFSAASDTASIGVTAVDDGPPQAPSVPDLQPGSDTGSSSTDNLTADTTPNFGGTGENGAIVMLFRDNNDNGLADAGEILGTDTVADGVWSITAGPLADGTYAIRALQTAIFANVSAASAALSVTIAVESAAPGSASPTGTSGGELLVLTGDRDSRDGGGLSAEESVELAIFETSKDDLRATYDPIADFLASIDGIPASGEALATPLGQAIAIDTGGESALAQVVDGPGNLGVGHRATSFLEAAGGTVYVFENGIWVGYDVRALVPRLGACGGSAEAIEISRVDDVVAAPTADDGSKVAAAAQSIDRLVGGRSFAEQVQSAAKAFDAEAAVLTQAMTALKSNRPGSAA